VCAAIPAPTMLSASSFPSSAPSIDPSSARKLAVNDTDAHGCILSAGYSYCESTGKCYRPWEENCTKTHSPTSPPGSDRDEHGCIPSAGYSYCEATGKCYRPWEEKCTSASNAPSRAPTRRLNRTDGPGSDTDANGCKPSAGEVYCEETKTCIEPSTESCPVSGGDVITGPASMSCIGSGRCDLSPQCQLSKVGDSELLGGLYVFDLSGNYDVPEGCVATCVECSQFDPSSATLTPPRAALGALAVATIVQFVLV
jgi:hypothetical protein